MSTAYTAWPSSQDLRTLNKDEASGLQAQDLGARGSGLQVWGLMRCHTGADVMSI